MTGEFGVCTFNWSCINVAHGVHIGPCVDRFFVGTCCKIPQGTAEQGQGPRKSDSYPYSGTRAGTSDNGVGEGTRKVGEMPPYSQFHHTVAPKAQKEKLNEVKPIHLIDIGHFNVSLSPADYYDFQYNGTSLPHHEQSSKLNNATDFEQNPSVDYRNFSSSSTQKLIPSASFFYAVLFSNYSKSESSKEFLNKTVDSVITLLGKNDSSSIHPYSSTNHDISHTKTTSPYSATASSVLFESPYALKRPVTAHPSLDQRQPLKPHEQHNLRKPVGYDTSHDLRRPVTPYNTHDQRKPLKPHDQHDLRNPVGLNEAHDQRWPVFLDEEDHDQRWPVLDEEDNDQRLPATEEESHDQRLSSLSDDNRLSIEHLFKWIGNHYTNSNQLSSSSDYSKVIPTSEMKTTAVSTNIMLTTDPTLSPTSHFSEESTVLNFGQQDVASTKATTTAFSFEESTNSLSNFTLFVRPTSSRPSYKPFQQLPEPKPTGGKIIFNDTSQVCGRSRSGTTARIVGGIKSHYLRWPWMISLRRLDGKSYKHKCGATLLNQYWAVTAAHCIDGKRPTDIILRLGEYNFRRADEMHPHVERRIYVMVIHPEFDRVTYENDLALLRFQEPVKLQANIVPVCLPRNLDDITGRIAVVTGWGRLSEDGELPTSLHEVHLPIVSNKECEQMYYEAGYAEKIREVFVCAGVSDGGLDACEGDSGGPMVVRGDHGEWVLVGLISWGMGCAAPKQPGVYTRISEFTEWVDGIIAH
ncbi:Serine proteinase stubble [Araneus ventricosus]|uniref:Serine proteinase stubble n=1 Tax=Araneus ventricosus TaxID=182803 RepID=A0A4Y2ALU3_ARAVE|nr:Serine proteinase stubble [Araneus ventricosus]